MLPDFEYFSGEAMSSVASPDSLKALLCGSAALRTAVVTVSPVSATGSPTDFSVAGSLILNGIGDAS